MPVCRHGTTAEQAFELIKRKLMELGYDKHVRWNGHNASVSVGLGVVLHISGRITNMEVIAEFGGAFSNTALNKCREIVGNIFPGSELI